MDDLSLLHPFQQNLRHVSEENENVVMKGPVRWRWRN